MSGNVLLSDNYRVTAIDAEGKKFDKVSRITCFNEDKVIEVTLDYASELIGFTVGETIVITLARSLHDDPMGSEAPKDRREMWRGGDQGLASSYEYVMYGKIYKFDESRKAESNTTAYLSFGGLLMAIRGNYRHLTSLVIGENVYLLVRHVNASKD